MTPYSKASGIRAGSRRRTSSGDGYRRDLRDQSAPGPDGGVQVGLTEAAPACRPSAACRSCRQCARRSRCACAPARRSVAAPPLTDRRGTRDRPLPHRRLLRFAAACHAVLRAQVRRFEAGTRPAAPGRSGVSRRPLCRPPRRFRGDDRSCDKRSVRPRGRRRRGSRRGYRRRRKPRLARPGSLEERWRRSIFTRQPSSRHTSLRRSRPPLRRRRSAHVQRVDPERSAARAAFESLRERPVCAPQRPFTSFVRAVAGLEGPRARSCRAPPLA